MSNQRRVKLSPAWHAEMVARYRADPEVRVTTLAHEFSRSSATISTVLARHIPDRERRTRTAAHRRNTGARNSQTKLTPSTVRQLRARAATGERHSTLARAYGISRTTVSAIVRRETWAHLPDTPLRSVAHDIPADERAWLAAVFDTAGSHSWIMRARHPDRAYLRLVLIHRDQTFLVKVRARARCGTLTRRQQGNWQWTIEGAKAIDLAATLAHDMHTPIPLEPTDHN